MTTDMTSPAERDALVKRLRERARIRRQIPTRKSVQAGEPDRIADLLDEAAEAIAALTAQPSAGEPVAVVRRSMTGGNAGLSRHVEITADFVLNDGELLYTHPPAQRDDAVVVPREVATHRLDNGAWRVFIGHICVASWIGSSAVSDGGQMMVRPEIAAKQLAAKINAEILGGVKAFGCEHEARGGTRCGRWCGYEKCPVSMASPGAQKEES